MDLELLKAKRTITWKELQRTHDMFEGVRITYEAFLKQYSEAKAEFEKADYALAEVDGRLQRIEEARSGKKVKSRPLSKEEEAREFLNQLSADELASTLAELGISLPEVEEVPLPEDVKLPNVVDVGD
jgi:uncharacterized protein YbaP (TraB family)